MRERGRLRDTVRCSRRNGPARPRSSDTLASCPPVLDDKPHAGGSRCALLAAADWPMQGKELP